MDKIVTALSHAFARRTHTTSALPFRRKALFEAMEPRLLLSADLLPGGVPAVMATQAALVDAPSVALTPQSSAFATPLTLSPVGAIEAGVRTSDVQRGTLAGDLSGQPLAQAYTVDLAEGQLLSVSGSATAAGFAGLYGVNLSVFDPDGGLLASVSAADSAVLQTLVAPVAGSYTLSLSVELRGANGEGGLPPSVDWTLFSAIDAAIEDEAVTSNSNGWTNAAQTLDTARALPLGNASRTAVVGQLAHGNNNADGDYYRITLAAGEWIEAETTLTSNQGYLQLLDTQGNLVASGVRSGEAMQWEGPLGLPRFVSDSDSDYYLKVESWWSSEATAAPLDYVLVVGRNASLDPDSQERLSEAGVQLVGLAPQIVASVASRDATPDAASLGASRQYLAVAQDSAVIIDIAAIADGTQAAVMPELSVWDAESGEALALTESALPNGGPGARYTVQALPGQTLRIVVASVQAGQWLMQVQGAVGDNAPPQVLGSGFNDALVAASQTYQSLFLSEPVRADQLGQPHLLNANGVEVARPTLQVFSQGEYVYVQMPSGLAAGSYSLVFDDGTLADLSGQPMPGFSFDFQVDDTRPQLLSPSITDVLDLQASDQSITLQFSEPMVNYWPSPTFTDASGQQLSPTWDYAWSEDHTALTIWVRDLLPTGVITMAFAEWTLQDLAGNTLDADLSTAGVQALQVRFTTDQDVYVMPALAAREPLGALVYASGVNAYMNGGNTTDDVDTFSIALAAGVPFSAVLSAQPGAAGNSLPRLDLTVIDPDGNTVAYGATSAPGRALLLPDLTTTMAGVWTLRVSSPDGGSGAYSASVVVGGAVQREGTEIDGVLQPSNGSRATAEDLDSSARVLAAGIDRLASVGRLSPGIDPATGAVLSDLDFFSFTLDAGQTASIVMAVEGSAAVSNLRMALFDASGDWATTTGQIVAAAVSSPVADRIILDYTNHSDSAVTLFARPRGDSAARYSIVVTRGATFDIGLIDKLPQALGPTGAVLGALDGSSLGGVAGGVGPIAGLPAQNMSVNDGSGHLWDVQTDGSISNGTYDAYDGGLYLSAVDTATGSNYGFYSGSGTRADASQTLALTQDIAAALRMDRRIYVPTNDGFARYLDQITNTGNTSRTITLSLNTNLGSDSGTNLIATDAADIGNYDRADHWLVTDDVDGQYDPSMAHVVWGDGGQAPDVATLAGDSIAQTWTVTLAPGQTVGLLHFAVQADNQAIARATAERLVGLPTEALVGLSAAELASIVNFSTSQGDAYRFWVNAGDELALSVQSLVDAGLPFSLRVLDADGVELLQTGQADGPLSGLSTGLTASASGEWTVQVFAPGSTGEYLLQVTGATGIAPAPQVVSASPAEGQPVNQLPYIDVTFDSFIRSDSAQASDLTLDEATTAAGAAVTSVEVRSGKTLRFHLNGQALPESTVGWTMAAGAVVGHDGQGNLFAQGNIAIDLTPPQVISATQDNTQAPLQFLAFEFSEDLDPASVSVDDIGAFTGPQGQDLRNQIYAVEVSGQTLTVQFYSQWALGTYSMTLNAQITDRAGNQLDQDGDGIGGEAIDDAFTTTVQVTQVDLAIDAVTVPDALVTGQPAMLSWVLRNQGNTAVPSGTSWVDRVWLQSASGDLYDVGDYSHFQADPLEPGQTTTVSQLISVPQTLDIASGDYFVRVQADVYSALPESNEGNNVGLSTETVALTSVHGDLVVRDVVTPNLVDGGNSVTVTWTDFNQGSGDALSPYGYYYDRIELLDSSDTVVRQYTQYYYTNGSIEAGTGEARSYTVSLPNDRTATEYRVRVTADVYNYVAELGNENNNSATSVPFTVRQVDLQTVAVSANTNSVTMGNALTVSWEVRNTGLATSSGQGWYDVVQLVNPTNGQVAFSTYVYVTPTLAAGASYTNSATFVVPTTAALAGGDYIVRVVADGYGYIAESNDNNNALDATDRLNIVAASVPDLVVTDVTPGVASIAANLDLALSWTVSNQGSATTTRGYYDYLYLVDGNGATTYLAQRYQGGALAAGATLTTQATVRVPHTVVPGSYRLRVVTDASGNIEELLNEGNNSGESSAITVTTAIVPDLRIDALVLPEQITLGQPLTLSWTGSNVGTGDVAAGTGWYDRVEFLRTNGSVAFSTYTYLTPAGGVPAAGGTYTGSITFTPPLDVSNLPEGSYRIRITADTYSNVNESNESNNARLDATLVPLVAGPTPDLVSTAPSVPESAPANTRITVSWTDRNEGDAATASGYYTRLDVVQASTGSTVLSVYPYFGDPSTIAAGGSAARSQELVLPASLTPGAYRIRLSTDYYGNVSEYDRESNNQVVSVDFAVTEAIRADLSNARFTSALPAAPLFGSSLALSYSVDNSGTGSTQNLRWTDRVQLVRVSDGAVVASVDTTAGNTGTGVAAGGSYSNTVSLSLPLTAGVNSGDYRLELLTDISAVLNEPNRNNNNASVALTVAVPPLADLVVSDVVAPLTAISGQPMDVSWVTDNRGDGDLYLRYGASYNYFSDRVYLADASGATLLFSLGDFQVNGPFGANADPLARVQRVNLPDTVANGSYRIVVVTDVNDYINEQNGEGANNRAMSALFTVSQPARVDLQVDTVSVPPNVDAGGVLALTWRTRNGGSADFTGSFSEVVQISPVADFSSGVQTLAPTLRFTGSIAAGAAVERNAQLNLPISVNGPNDISKSWFVRVVTDYNAEVYEYNLENNNASTPGTTVVTRPALPDLVVTVVDAPDAAVAGTEVVVTYTVTNNGTAVAGARTDRIRLNVESGSAWALQLDNAVNESLAVGASQTLTVRFTLPINSGNTGFSGRLRAQATADIGNVVAEYPLDDNNTRLDTNQLVVSLPALPNLSVGNIIAPVDALTETDIPLRWTITNNGTAATTSGWTDQLFLSADSVLDGNDRLLGNFSTETTLAAGGSIERVQTLTLPRDLVGTWHVLVRTDATGQIFEGTAGESDNVAADTDTLTTRLRPLPNLVVQSVTPPANAFSGQTAIVSWTVANVGTGATTVPAWYDAVYLSLDDTLDAADTQLAVTVNPGYLEVGAAYANSVSVNLPRGIDGNYRFFVVTDVYNSMFEGVASAAAEHDNTSAPATARITLTPPPDLQVTAVSAPPQAFSGEPVNVSWTVLNDGEGRTRETSWVDRVYLSADATLDAGDALLADVTHTGALDAGKSYNGNTVATLPIGVSGPFYFIVVTDGYGQVYEHTLESNNARVEDTPTTILLTPPPDLEIVDSSFAVTARAGTTFSVQLRVDNRGGTDTPARQAAWYDQVWLSLDDIIDANDRVLGTGTHYGVVATDAGYDTTISGLLPADMQGVYKVLARVDTGNNLFEGIAGSVGESNNTLVLGTVSVFQSRPDLVVSGLTLPDTLEAGRTALFAWTVTNQGNGDTIAASWSDSLWFSQDDALGDGNDVLIGSVGHAGVLAPGASYSVNVAPALPFALKGTGHFYVRTDAGGQVNESSEANNLSAVATAEVTRRESDLTVTEATVTPVAGDDRSFDLHFVVRNDGIAATHLNAWNDGVWLSTDSVIGAGDLRVKTVYRGNPLAAGDSYTVDVRITVPSTVPEGGFKVLVRADEDNAVIESAENNNVAQAQVSIGGVPAPDGKLPIGSLEVLTPEFSVVSVDAPESAFSGQQITVNWTVRNDGDAAQNPYWWSAAYDQVYLSSDPFLDSGDISLGYASWASQDGGGNEVQRSLTVTLPVGRSGPFYVLVKADAGNRFAETAELNNTGFDPALLNVALAPPADLVAGTISLPANAQPGQAMEITYTVDNASTNAAIGAWRDTLYLSRDDVLDTGDTVFGSVDVYGPVAGGTSYSRTVHAVVPGVDPGEYKLIVRSDVRNVLAEASESNNLSASVDAVTLDVPALTLGVATSGTVLAGQSLFFKVNVGAGEALRFSLDGPGEDVAHDLWISYASVPSRSHNDVGSGEQYTPDPVLTVPTTEAGVYYVRVDAGFASGAYTLRADLVPFSVERVSENSVGNTGEATLRVDGARFDANTRFELVATDGTVFDAVAVWLRDAGRGYVTFNLYGADVGVYDLRALRVDAATGATVQAAMTDAVTVKNGDGADAFLTITGPTAVQVNRDASFQLNYSNDGDADTRAPLIIVTPSNGTTIGLSAKTLGTDPLFILGTSLDGPLDLLRPGAHYSLPVAYKAPGEAGYLSIEARPVQANSVETITDWASIERSLRPAGVNLVAWQTFWGHLQPSLGRTMGDLVNVLNDMAQRLSPAGDPIRDVRALFAAQMAADATWRAATTVSGKLATSSTGAAAADVSLGLYSYNGISYTRVGTATSDAGGNWRMNGITGGRYVLAADARAIDMDGNLVEDEYLPEIEVSTSADVNAGTIYLVPTVVASALRESAPVLASDGAGGRYVSWSREGDLWVARRDGDQWVDATRIAEGNAADIAMVASDRLLDGSTPGVVVAWRTGDGNASELYFAVGLMVNGHMQWSAPVRLTDDAVSDSAPELSVDAQGRVTVVYLKENADIQDDADLYTVTLSISSTGLKFSEVPAAYGLGVVPEQVTTEGGSLARSWKLWSGSPLGISIEVKAEVGIKHGVEGCDYKANGYANISVKLGDAAYKGVSAFESPLKGSLTGQVNGKATWIPNLETQDWQFKEATASWGVKGELDWTNGLLIVLEKLGPQGLVISTAIQRAIGLINRYTPLTVSNGLKGSLAIDFESMRWTGQAPFPDFLFPDDPGKSSLTLEFGPYLRFENKAVKDVKLDLSGTIKAVLQLTPTISPKSLSGTIKIEGEVYGWKASKSLELFNIQSASELGFSPQDADTDGFEFVFDAASLLGTGNVYGDNAMFDSVGTDVLSDGPVSLARAADGTLTAVWSRTLDPTSGARGDEIRTATLVDGNWVPSGAIAGVDGYVSDVHASYDGNGQLVVVWSRVDDGGASGPDSFTALNALRDRADLYVAVQNAGVWSTPAAITQSEALDADAALGRAADGSLVLAWVSTQNGSAVLHTSSFNGTGFGAITDLVTADSVGHPSFLAVGNTLELYWSQDVDAGSGAQSALMHAVYASGSWSAPTSFSYSLMPQLASAWSAAPAMGAAFSGGFSASGLIPDEPVPEKCLKCKPEKVKKVTEAAPDCRPGGGSTVTFDEKKCVEKTITYAPCVTRPRDPNDILGPDGFGEQQWIKASDALGYTIRFENAADATAPAQVVTVTQTLDTDLDPRSFRVGSFGFGEVRVEPKESRAFYSTRLDLRETQGIYVDVTVNIDTTTRVATWTFTSIDPQTGDVPVDATLGFLMPNDSSGRGDGFVSYTVKAVRTAVTGTVIDAQARIVFDTEAPIDTPPIFNTLDVGLPSSQVEALPATTDSNTFTVRWAGTDAAGGSAIRDYEVYARTDGGDWALWQLATTDTEALFEGEGGHVYAFYSVARDNAGNVEAAPAAADASIRVLAQTGSVAGLVFNDIDFNGTQNAGEGGAAGWTVFVDANADGVLDDGEASVVTTEDGTWTFAALQPGDWRIAIAARSGYEVTSPVAGYFDVAVTAGGANTGRNFGTLALGSIGGAQFNDLNGNGQREAGEAGLAGWTVFIDVNGDGLLGAGERSTVTAADGTYAFVDLRPGTYQVATVTPEGWVQTRPGTASAGQTQTATVLTLSGSLASISLPACACGGTITALAAQQAGWDEQLVALDTLRADPGYAGVNGSGVRVVVIDTGIDVTHPFFDGRIVYQYDFADNDALAIDRNGHGTHVAGVIAGSDPMFGGVAPGAELIVLKVFGDDGSASFATLERALQWVSANAAAWNIGVVNLSLGDGSNWDNAGSRYGLGDEFAALAAQNIITVAAAGNNYASVNALGVAYPAADPAVLAVGAVWAGDFGGPWRFGNGGIDEATGSDHIASFSQRDDDQIDIFAPGARLTSASLGGGVRTMQGTSQSAAYVSGVAALAQQMAHQYLGRALSTGEFHTLLASTAVSINDGDDERDNVVNTGLDFPRLNVKALADAIVAMSDGTMIGGGGSSSGGDTGNAGAVPVLPAAGGSAVTVTLAAGEAATGIDFGAFQLGRVSGLVYDDRNRNGQHDAAEAGIAGATVFIDVNDNGQWDEGETTVTTDADGRWSLNSLRAGRLTVAETLPAGWARDTAPGMHSITVTSGLDRSDLDFGRHDIAPDAQDDSASTVDGRSVSGNVLDNDSDPGRADKSLLEVSLVSGPAHGTLTLGTDGAFTYAPAAGFEGSDSFRYALSDGVSQREATVVISVGHRLLVVNSFNGGHDGFTVNFSRPIATDGLDLDGANGDIVVTNAAGQVVQGSLFVTADGNGARFLASGGVLADGNYSVRLRAGAQALRDATGVALDGNADGSAGDDWLGSFNVTRNNAVTVGLADTARGPGQVLGVAIADTGLAVRLSNGAGVTSVRFTLAYDPALLGVATLARGSGLPAAATFSVTPLGSGLIAVEITATAGLPAGAITLAQLVATVPTGVAYGAAGVIDVRDLQVNGGALAALDDDAVHVAAFTGDVTRDRQLSSADVALMRQLLAGDINRLPGWALLDGRIIGDVNGSGLFDAVDPLRLEQALAGMAGVTVPVPDAPVVAPPTPPVIRVVLPPRIVPTLPGPKLAPTPLSTVTPLVSLSATIAANASIRVTL